VSVIINNMEEQIIKTATDIIQPVFESAIILAGEYMKACKRNILTGEDVQYALKYCSRNFVGKQIGTLFPEEESSDSEDSDSDSEVDEEDDPFIRYSGDDKLMNDINQAVDSWDEWIPASPTEHMLKDSVDKTYR
jgi:hypothetical protein